MHNFNTLTGIIILAAGSSSRLGMPKQTLMYNNKSLLQHAVSVASEADNVCTVVVLGAKGNEIEGTIEEEPVLIVHNPDWEQGMGASIKAGLTELLHNVPDIEAVIIMVCDQPYVSTALLKQLEAKQEQTGKGMIACSYGGTVGVPALFGRTYFDALLTLNGSEGAKKIIMQHETDAAFINFEKGTVDIDTPEDYERLKDVVM